MYSSGALNRFMILRILNSLNVFSIHFDDTFLLLYSANEIHQTLATCTLNCYSQC